MKTWLYALSKERLISVATEYGIDTTGTLDEIRHRTSHYIDLHPEEFGAQGPDARNTRTPPRMEITPPSEDRDERREIEPANTQMLEQLRKWGRPFDGRDPIAFLERIDDLRADYEYSGEQLLKGLSELLRGDAVAWARNNREDWTWGDFCNAIRRRYLPPRYSEDLQQQIAERKQRETEKFAPYADEMMTLIRRAGGFSREQRLSRIYANMRPEYKRYVKRRDVHDLNELFDDAAEFERIEQEQPSRRPYSAATSTVTTAYNREECCWRCKQRGHTRFQCKQAPRRFCSQCGKDGVLTSNCHPPSGNARRAGSITAEPLAPRRS